eukprot:280829-Chlamydomonas_euryale.AAC.4
MPSPFLTMRSPLGTALRVALLSGTFQRLRPAAPPPPQYDNRHTPRRADPQLLPAHNARALPEHGAAARRLAQAPLLQAAHLFLF